MRTQDGDPEQGSGPEHVVRRFWDRIQARDWAGVRAVLAEDVIVDWPETAERFRGADAVVAVNAEYPEGWEIRLLRTVVQEDTVVAEVEVPHEGLGVFRVASIVEVRDGLIVRAVEYWNHEGGSAPPAWRDGMAERLPGTTARSTG